MRTFLDNHTANTYGMVVGRGGIFNELMIRFNISIPKEGRAGQLKSEADDHEEDLS